MQVLSVLNSSTSCRFTVPSCCKQCTESYTQYTVCSKYLIYEDVSSSYLSLVERQKGLTTSHLHTQLYPFAFKVMKYLFVTCKYPHLNQSLLFKYLIYIKIPPPPPRVLIGGHKYLLTLSPSHKQKSKHLFFHFFQRCKQIQHFKKHSDKGMGLLHCSVKCFGCKL